MPPALVPPVLLLWMGNGYSVLLAVCSAICPAAFGHVLPICMGQNILVNESMFNAIHFVFHENGRQFPFNN
jgi:hypothetical protein